MDNTQLRITALDFAVRSGASGPNTVKLAVEMLAFLEAQTEQTATNLRFSPMPSSLDRSSVVKAGDGLASE